MDGQSPMIHIVRPVTEQVKKLRIHDRHDKIERVIGVGDNDKQRCLFIPNHIKLKFVIACQITQLLDVKGGLNVRRS